jgi:hypothetical protein
VENEVRGMAVQEVVRILRELIQDEGATLQRRYGLRSLTIAQGMRSLLSARLCGELPYASLWREFEAEPQGTAAQLVGALEALVEADPSLAQQLGVLVEEYHWAIGPPRTGTTRTAGQGVPVWSDVPDTTVAVDEDKDVGRGTYLYGNVKPGSISVGRGVKAQQDSFGGHDGVEEGNLNVAVTGLLFNDLYTALETYPDLNPTVKADIEEELQGVLAQIALGQEANEEILARHLRDIRRMNSDILEVVLNKLADPDVESGAMMQRAVQRLEKHSG